MILDDLKNAKTYFSLHKSFQLAFEYLQQTNFSQVENGKYPLDGENVFAVVNRYETHHVQEPKWEAHRKYIDIQYIASGFEQIGVEDISEVPPLTEYDEEKDVRFFIGDGKHFPLAEKTFAIIFPHEVHLPGIAGTQKSEVLKVVVKVKVV